MKITINKQVELMCGLLLCSDYATKSVPMMCEDTGNSFRKANVDFVSKFKNEKVFNLLNEIVNDKTANFTWEAPIVIALHMDENYNFFGENCYTFTGKLHHNQKIIELVKEIKIFAKKANYDSFFSSHQNQFDLLKEQHSKAISTDDIDNIFRFMADFYMFTPIQDNYFINLMPSLSWTGIGTEILDKICVSDSLKKNKTKGWQFQYHDDKREYIAHILHEFSHPIINPATDKANLHFSIITDWNYISDKLGVGYANFWKSYINEQIIRAIQLYFLEKIYKFPIQDRIIREEDNGYLHTKLMLRKLYEIENKHYNNFAEKYQELLTVFQESIKGL